MRICLSLVCVLLVGVVFGCGKGEEKKGDMKDSGAAKKGSGTRKAGDAKKDDDREDDSGEKENDKKDDKPAPPAGDPNTLTLTADNTKIEFEGSKDDGKHKGGFKTITGEIQLGSSGPKSIDVTIETNSLWSDDKKLTEHLKHEDFFFVDVHPKASLTTVKIEPATEGDATHILTASLMMRGVTKDGMRIPVKVEQSDGGFKLTADFEISRKEFEFAYAPDKVHDTVKIHVEVDTSSN